MLPTTNFHRFFSIAGRSSITILKYSNKNFQKPKLQSDSQYRMFSMQNNLSQEVHLLKEEVAHLKHRIIYLETQNDHVDRVGLIGFIFAIYVLNKFYKKEEKAKSSDATKSDLRVNKSS